MKSWQYSHLGNYYSVVMMPDSVWSFEMIESWYAGDGKMAVGADYEDARGLDHYPSIAGAYFSARLAVAEHLSRRRRKASALVLREIHPEYVMPVGVWQIREGVREAMKKPARTFDGIEHGPCVCLLDDVAVASEILRAKPALQDDSEVSDKDNRLLHKKGHIPPMRICRP